MAMTTGTRRSSMRSSRGFKLSRQMIFPEVSSPNSLISAPAMNVRPAPINTTALTVSSFSICATAAAMPAETAALSAFTGGLFIVTTAIPSIFVSCTRSLINCSRIRISGERYADFLRNDAQLLDHRHNQRHTLLAAHFFRIAFRVAGDERAVRAGRGSRSAKHADEVVHLPLELIRFDEAVDAHRSEKVPDSLPHAARRNFLAQRKGRREGPPIGPAQYAAQNVDHDAEAITFVPAALAIGAKRQERAARDDVVGIRRATPLMIDAPTLRYGFPSAPRHLDFDVRCGARGHVHHDKRLLFSGKRNGDGIRAEHALRAPQRRDQFRGISHSHADHVALQRLQHVISGDAKMIAVANADPPGAGFFRHAHGNFIRLRPNHQAKAVVAIDGCGARRRAQ